MQNFFQSNSLTPFLIVFFDCPSELIQFLRSSHSLHKPRLPFLALPPFFAFLGPLYSRENHSYSRGFRKRGKSSHPKPNWTHRRKKLHFKSRGENGGQIRLILARKKTRANVQNDDDCVYKRKLSIAYLFSLLLKCFWNEWMFAPLLAHRLLL